MTEASDLKWLWAAYRKGGLSELELPEDLSVEEFKQILAEIFATSGWTVWTLLVDEKPIGIVTGWVHGRQITMSRAFYFPWASKRNIWEAMLNFFDRLRKTAVDQMRDTDDPLRYPVILEFAHFKDKRFWERMADKGVMRKVGHVHHLEDKPSVLFQARAPVGGK